MIIALLSVRKKMENTITIIIMNSKNLINDAKLKVILNGAQLRPEENAEENSQLQTFYDNLSYNYGVECQIIMIPSELKMKKEILSTQIVGYMTVTGILQ